ncbi:unnamed protein product, partial [Prorocentrum cordatum]
ALFREPGCCLDTACSRKLRDAYTDSAAFLADDEVRDLIMSWAVTGTVCSMDIERIFASIRLSVPEGAPFAERVVANGTLAQVQRLHREHGGIDANTFRRSDAVKMDMPTVANVETAIRRPLKARGNILFMRRAIEAERAALPDGRTKFTKHELQAIRKAASKEYTKLSQQTQMVLAEEAKNDANARAAADETLDAAPPETPFNANPLWGCASVDCPLSVDVARDAVLLKTGKAKVGGLRSYSGPFRKPMRDRLMVRDQNDIPASEQVRHYHTCAVGHPGVCRDADAEIYKMGGFLLSALNSFVVSQGRVAEGQGLSLSARRNGVDDPLLQMWLVVAYKRKGDPLLFVCASLRAVDGAADVFDIVTADSTIPMLVGHSIVGSLLRLRPDQVLAASMELASLPGFLLRVRVKSIGDA